jgi:hypothetical protein
MAKKIQLIDDPDTDDVAETEEGIGISSTEKQKLMKTIEAVDWKLWEIYRIAQAFAKHFDIDVEELNK